MTNMTHYLTNNICKTSSKHINFYVMSFQTPNSTLLSSRLCNVNPYNMLYLDIQSTHLFNLFWGVIVFLFPHCKVYWYFLHFLITKCNFIIELIITLFYWRFLVSGVISVFISSLQSVIFIIALFYLEISCFRCW